MTNPPYPPPPQYPYGSPYPPPQPPKKKAKWPLLFLVGALAFCGLAGCIALVNGFDNAVEESTSSSVAPGQPTEAAVEGGGQPEADQAPAGEAVRDGKFEFVVTKVDQGLTVAGTNPYMQTEAQGQYVLVYTTVTNTGDQPQSYFGENQKLIDVQGREFTNDTMAEMNVNDSGVMMADINPGNSLDVVIAFDIPADAQPAAIEFHDSMFSGGAKVALQ
ncbi:DUF4352 domain-containing protein [Nocardia carnea]|jgi:hypothetical protein|uniref:DUF4352 domain-containing protein n=1 Tax=Nocardia carnea TaxID=37328 RepID=A0ABW7TEI4_9NOCA|nr:DUF4352 domain-containing protein [Nocardia carnea]